MGECEDGNARARAQAGLLHSEGVEERERAREREREGDTKDTKTSQGEEATQH
jgi:hypothetical protein